MIPNNNVKGNINRFSGFADCYDKYRPEAPRMVAEILTKYLGRKPSLVVDIGCGTGLSTFVWQDYADRVIGVEPNQDMLGKAQEKLIQNSATDNIQFYCGYSNQTGIEANTVDVITCSQSFHWMEPVSTLDEVSRVLIDGGVFAAYDCDWPPVINWVIEDEFVRLIRKAGEIVDKYSEGENRVRMWGKDEQLRNIRESNKFRYVREVVFHSIEKCDSNRFIGLALSQGVLQTVIKMETTDIDTNIEMFTQKVENFFKGNTLDILFCYRMRLGVK